jgi:1,5-anhydro-D-fructose reductase (1,5-anhydro-D-mannitol-forming)
MAMRLGWGLIGASTIGREWVIDAIRARTGNEVVAVLEATRSGRRVAVRYE